MRSGDSIYFRKFQGQNFLEHYILQITSSLSQEKNKLLEIEKFI